MGNSPVARGNQRSIPSLECSPADLRAMLGANCVGCVPLRQINKISRYYNPAAGRANQSLLNFVSLPRHLQGAMIESAGSQIHGTDHGPCDLAMRHAVDKTPSQSHRSPPASVSCCQRPGGVGEASGNGGRVSDHGVGRGRHRFCGGTEPKGRAGRRGWPRSTFQPPAIGQRTSRKVRVGPITDSCIAE
jgi:hypothetical protein